MNADSKPLTAPVPEISHRRILTNMVVIVAVAAAAGFAGFSLRVGAGVLVGGILAFLNYFWQKHSLKIIFERAVNGRPARFLALRYILRYAAIGLALGLVYLTGGISIFAVIFGLSSFALAVVAEGFITIFSAGFRKESY